MDATAKLTVRLPPGPAAALEAMVNPPEVRSLAHAAEILIVEALEARGWKRPKKTA